MKVVFIFSWVEKDIGCWLKIINFRLETFSSKKNSKVQFCLKFVFTAIQKESKKW